MNGILTQYMMRTILADYGAGASGLLGAGRTV